MARTRKTSPVEPTVEYPPFDGTINVDVCAGGDWIKGATQDGYEAPAGVSYQEDASGERRAGPDNVEPARELSEDGREPPESSKPAPKVVRKALKPRVKVVAPTKVACTGKQRDGASCRMPVVKGTAHCFNHLTDDERTERNMPTTSTKASGPRWLSGTFEDVIVRRRGKEQSLRATFSVEDGKRVVNLY